MDPYLVDWLAALVRVVHVVAAIAWIGASFYFVWLDNRLEAPPDWKAERGIAGDLWAIHGGGVYEVAKYRLGPEQLPPKLHWFKWEAYTTWLSGVALLVATYYVHAQTYLVGPESWMRESGWAIGASVAYLVVGWHVYERLVRTSLARRGTWFAVAMTVVVAAMSWLAFGLFAPRAAFVHVGALLATIMAGNVFVGIIPAQRAFVAALESGTEPDAERAAFAKLRSTHNNYFTLPVVICMVSNHAPFLYAGAWSWLMLVGVCGLSVVARHFFNLRNRGVVRPALLWAPAVALAALAIFSGWLQRRDVATAPSAAVEPAVVAAVVEQRCAVCHSARPSFPGILAAPGGIRLESLDEVRRSRDVVLRALETRYMPLGNVTKISEDEREALLAWLRTP